MWRKPRRNGSLADSRRGDAGILAAPARWDNNVRLQSLTNELYGATQMESTNRPSIVEIFLTWLSLAASGVLGLLPCGLLVGFVTWLIPSENMRAPISEVNLGLWTLPLILGGFLAVALVSVGIHVTVNLWILFAEPRFSREAIGLVIGGEQRIPKMQKRALRISESVRRLASSLKGNRA